VGREAQTPSRQPPSPDSREAWFTSGWALDRESVEPAYTQIAARIVDLIAAGGLTAGDRLPAERDLAAWVGVSRMTARAALGMLAARGMLDRDVGRGTFVARAKLEHDLSSFAGFTDMVRREGMAARARIRAINELPAPDEVGRALGLKPGALAYRIERVRYADDEPLTLEDSWLPVERFPGLLEHDVRGSLYALMGEVYDSAPVRAVERLEPALATPAQAAALELEPGAPLMLITRVAFSARDEPVEYARDHHRGDRARFVVEVATPPGSAI
jgi:DNA-binding GntR family transcriptional regulator